MERVTLRLEVGERSCVSIYKGTGENGEIYKARIRSSTSGVFLTRTENARQLAIRRSRRDSLVIPGLAH
ncbi:hypothetical protein SLE2022_296750 [Rubroshorea leprosula]